MQKVKIKTEAQYLSHNIKSNKSVDIVFKTPYSELKNILLTMQMLNENVTVGAKIGPDKKVLKLGMFMVKNINVDNDGEGKLKLNSLLDHVDANSINTLAVRNDEPLVLLLKCDIDIEDEDSEDEEEEDSDTDPDEMLPFPEVE